TETVGGEIESTGKDLVEIRSTEMVEVGGQAGVTIVEDDHLEASADQGGEQVGMPAGELRPEPSDQQQRQTVPAVDFVGQFEAVDPDDVGPDDAHDPDGSHP